MVSCGYWREERREIKIRRKGREARICKLFKVSDRNLGYSIWFVKDLPAPSVPQGEMDAPRVTQLSDRQMTRE
jgi:hypothetical protein